MSHDNRPHVPCGLCGEPTPMLGTKRCDRCWELEKRVQRAPAIALKVLIECAAETIVRPCVTCGNDRPTVTAGKTVVIACGNPNCTDRLEAISWDVALRGWNARP